MGKKRKTRVNRATRRRAERTGQPAPVTARAPAAPEQDIRGEGKIILTIGGHIRNAGEHPLTLAYVRGKLGCTTKEGKPTIHERIQSGCAGCERFTAGNDLRSLCATLERSGRDSTDLEHVSAGATPQPWADIQARAARALGDIRSRLGGAESANWLICRALCGDGQSLVASVRAANVPCHPNGILPRVQEALDALAGRKRPNAAAGAKPQRAAAPAPAKPAQTVCAGCGEKLCMVHPVKSRLCELVLCLACYRAEGANPAEAHVARYRAALKTGESGSISPPKRAGERKVA